MTHLPEGIRDSARLSPMTSSAVSTASISKAFLKGLEGEIKANSSVC